MTEDSIADSLNVTEYQEPSAGASIASRVRELYTADNFDELAAVSGDMLADGAKFMGGAAADVVLFTFDPVGLLTSMGLDMVLELIQPLQDWLHQVTGDGPAIGHAADNFVTLAQGFVEFADD